jgi:excisionase family DNA binding protein
VPRIDHGPVTLSDLEGRDFATVPEYASIVRCDPRTVVSDIKAGSIPATKAGREYRISVEFIRRAVATPQEWARREAAKIPPMTAGQVRQMALEARRADALHVPGDGAA